MLSYRNKLGLMIAALGLVILAGCGGGSGTDNNQVDLPTCQDPLVLLDNGVCGEPKDPFVPPACQEGQIRNDTGVCVVPDFPVPERIPGPDEVVIYVNVDSDTKLSDFANYNLHLWQDCGNGWGDSITDAMGDTYAIPTTWPNGPHATSTENEEPGERHDPYYGAFFVIPISELGTCGNLIIKTPGGAAQTSDLQLSIKRDGGDYERMAWVIINTDNMQNSRFSTIPICINDVCSLERPLLSITDVEAHWISPHTIIWNREFAADKKVQLFQSTAGGMSGAEDGSVVGGTLLTDLSLGRSLTDEEKLRVPHLASYIAYDLPADISLETIKSALKDELLIVGRYDSAEEDDNGNSVTIERGRATRIQLPEVLDALYTAAENDADEAQLGVNYNDGVGVSVWAPTAQNVELRIYSGEPLRVADTQPLQWDNNTGIWSYKGSAAELDGKFYRFRVTTYNPVAKQVVRLEVTDPYSVSLSTNGRHSQFVNLADESLKPAGWDSHAVPGVSAPEAMSIYEVHVRDFSANDQSTPAAYRGKYMAFTQTDSAPVEHLQALADAGLTYIHLLPANDSSSINEDFAAQVNLDSYIFELCQKVPNPDAVSVCDGSVSNGMTVRSVLESYDPQTAQARTLTAAIADLDAFNWGYDPQHYNAPEGSYATDPQGAARVKEMRTMNMALHEMGLRVVMDVVYPHTVSSGIDAANSVFDKIVPGYYYRTNPATAGAENGTFAGSDTATEHRMMSKFVADSLVQWAREYKVDGFRFDQSGFMPKSVLVDAYEAVKAVDEDNYFYAEAWTPTGGTSGDRIAERATQVELAGTGIGTFNDRLRNPLQQMALIKGDNVDAIRAGLAGNLKDFQLKTRSGAIIKAENVGAYNLDPQEGINYVEKHDNETLWDWMHRPDALPVDMSLSNRVRVHSLTLSIPILSQGVPFFHMGSDLLRSKSMSPNSYNAGDWFNAVDFTRQSNNWGVGLPPELRDGITDEYVASLFANPETTPGSVEIETVANVFQEFLRIASGSPLFSLTTAEDVMDRVGFHDGGNSQVPGLIIMSIDDGVGTVANTDSLARADLDATADAMVVIINGTDASQSAKVTGATGFVLHPLLQSSIDSIVTTSSFTEAEDGGVFAVPAYTTAVFVKPQSGAQGEGLSATASIGSAVPVPYGDAVLYVRGDVSTGGWDPVSANRMQYDGNGIYSVLLDVTAGAHQFKIANADWTIPNLGSSAPATVGGSVTLQQGNIDNVTLDVAVAGTYRFELDASESTSAPALKVVDPDTFQGVSAHLRGTVTAASWDATAVNQLIYEGDSIYALSVALAPGDYTFKVASSDWSTIDLGSVTPVIVGQDLVLVPGSNDDIHITITSAATYRFEVDARNPDAPVIKVYVDDLYSATPVYVRGTISAAGWEGTTSVNQLTYAGRGLYALTLNIAAGDYEFKIAEANWSDPSLGAPSIAVGQPTVLTQGFGGNIAVTIPATGDYRFTLDTTNAEAVSLTVDALTL